jgi:taurine dioxygenase
MNTIAEAPAVVRANLRAEPLTCAIGAELFNVNLGDASRDDALFAEIRALLLTHKVLFLRNQDITRAEHVAFARRFGELEDHPVAGSDPENPASCASTSPPTNRTTATRMPGTPTPRGREKPPFGCVLRCVECPPVGGDTMWANMALAYERLPAHVKTQIQGLRARHSIEASFGAAMPPEKRLALHAQFPDAEHPVVRTHPETGAKVLFVNAYTTHFTNYHTPERVRFGQDYSPGAPQLLSYLISQAFIPSTRCAGAGSRTASRSGTTAARSTTRSWITRRATGRWSARESSETCRSDVVPRKQFRDSPDQSSAATDEDNVLHPTEDVKKPRQQSMPGAATSSRTATTAFESMDATVQGALRMYRHILVPIDDSPLSGDTVAQAVVFARSIGAKVTFFHAQSDYASSSVGALQRVMSPGAFNEDVAGEARALLAKAEVVARTAGIEHDAVAMTCDRPHEAILGIAEARNCDLVFMASHGKRGLSGLVLGSQTMKVLQAASIPVLVSSVESNRAPTRADAALAILRDEHRVAGRGDPRTRVHRARGARARQAASVPLLRAVVHYVRAFAEALHHPKEDAYLFPLLRARTTEYDDTLDSASTTSTRRHGVHRSADQASTAYEADPAERALRCSWAPRDDSPPRR